MARANGVTCALSIACADGFQTGLTGAARAAGLALGRTFSVAFGLAFTFVMAPLSPTPEACQPGLLLAWQARRPVVVFELGETRLPEIAAPRLQVVVGAIASTVPAFLVVAARIGAEQHAPGLQARVQFTQHARQLAT